MDARDLLIGDWVALKSDKTPIKVETNLGGAINIERSYFSGSYEGGIYDEDLEPIPLTHEVLEKIGFKEYGPYYGNKEYTSDFHVMLRSWTNGESFNFHFREPETGRDCWFPYPVKYVHELQHYFKDCKIEKEIIL